MKDIEAMTVIRCTCPVVGLHEGPCPEGRMVPFADAVGENDKVQADARKKATPAQAKAYRTAIKKGDHRAALKAVERKQN